MLTITKATAKLHCRTCLSNIQNVAHSDSKDICINIANKRELEDFIKKYITNEKAVTSHGDEYPKCICLACFNKLQEADKFLEQAKLSEEKLFALFDSDETVAYDVNTDDTSRDIYKLLLRDSLMETESVLLESTTSSNINTEVNHPDPFGMHADSKKVSTAASESSHSSDDDDDWERSSANSLPLEKQMTQRRTRSSNKSVKTTTSINREDSNEELSHSTHSDNQNTHHHDKKKPNLCQANVKRKKRRTKKEITEHIHDTDVHESKSKRRQKGSKNNFKCTQCNHSFAHKITLDAHIRKIHEGSKRPFQCDRCEKSYTFIGGLYTHIKETHEAEVRSYACDFPNCDRIYTSFIAMQKHKRLKHTDVGEQKKYVCEQCGATFNQSGNLKYHRRIKHPTEAEIAEKEREKERFECTICKKLFHSRYTLKYHTLQLHTNETKYECNVCGRRMAKKFMLVQHQLVHSTEKMPCEHCGKQFIRKFELEAHIRAVHMKLKPFECQYCSECFASRKTLKHHTFIHTGEKPYACDLCGQAYRQQTCLKNHRKSHEKSRTEPVMHLASNINQSLMNTIQLNTSALIADERTGTTVMR